MRNNLQQFIDTIKTGGKSTGTQLLRAIDAITVGDKDRGARLLADLLDTNPRDELAWLWMAYAVNDIGRKRECLERMLALNKSGTGEAGPCLLSYGYPALQGITDAVRCDFAFSVAWRHNCRHLIWDGANEPLAVLLGTAYTLDIDIDALTNDLDTSLPDDATLPVPYDQRAELWPGLDTLQALSLPARKVFVRAMQMVQVWSGFADYFPNSFFTDRQECIPGFHDALAELAKAGFIDLNPSPADLLMHLTVKDLKQFAFDRGLKPRGSKYELIQEIVASVAHDAIEALLKEKLRGDRQYIRVTVDNFPLLKKYVRVEIHRLDLYLTWVRLIHCLGWSPQTSFGRSVLPKTDTTAQTDHT